MQIEQDLASGDWDNALVGLGGHPWQSAQWGDARREVDGVVDHRWLLRSGRDIVQMLRFEERRIRGVGKVAWIPRGPVTATDTAVSPVLSPHLRDCLKSRGFMLAVANPWRRVPDANQGQMPGPRGGRTIWLDLTLGKDQLWRNLERQVRYGVGRAERSGVTIERALSNAALGEFFRLCFQVSCRKGFHLRTSEPLMERLLNTRDGTDTEAQLFLGRCDGRIAAGAFVLRCGKSLHYLWGASDLACSKQRAGEALQWAIVEWAIDRGCARYDLEGIDPQGNPGTYSFKKKMGGEEVALMGRQIHPLDLKGQLLAPLATFALGSSWAALPSLVRSVWPRVSPQRSNLA